MVGRLKGDPFVQSVGALIFRFKLTSWPNIFESSVTRSVNLPTIDNVPTCFRSGTVDCIVSVSAVSPFSSFSLSVVALIASHLNRSLLHCPRVFSNLGIQHTVQKSQYHRRAVASPMASFRRVLEQPVWQKMPARKKKNRTR